MSGTKQHGSWEGCTPEKGGGGGGSDLSSIVGGVNMSVLLTWCQFCEKKKRLLWHLKSCVVMSGLGLFSLFFSCSNDFFPTHPYRIVSSLAFSISLLRIVSYSLRVGCGSRTTEKIKTNRTFFFVADSFCCYKAKEMLFCVNLSVPIYNWHDFLHGFPFHL